MSDAVLDVKDLRISFMTEEGKLNAVNGASFSIERGKVMGLVGESGCGKSVTGFSLLKIIQKPGRVEGGSIVLNSRDGKKIDITALPDNSPELFRIRGNLVSMIFQEPITALSPVHSIGNQLCEALELHRKVSRAQSEARVVEMLNRVGISGGIERLRQYPHELSGGMRQRVVIAMALMCGPELLVADEPTTALDVTIQARVLGVIKKIQKETGTSVLFITHDLSVISQMADDVAVMYLGRIVEHGTVRDVIRRPRHPYTRGLLSSLPDVDGHNRRLASIQGTVPFLSEIPDGCPFHPRCGYANPGLCDRGGPPDLVEYEKGSGHYAACIRAREIGL